MNLFLSILVTFICMPWPALIMMSPMMIAAPGFANKKSSILVAMLFFIYPAFVFNLLHVSGYSFYGSNALWWAAIAVALGALVSIVYGLPRQLINVFRGIANYDYFIKDQNVYLNGKKIKGADASTFTHFNNRGYYSKDATHVYYNESKVEQADAETFQPLLNDDTKHFWHDKKNVYYAWKGLTKADGASIVYAGNGYVFDKNHVYFEDLLIEEADRNTFTVLFGHCGRDSKNVFVRTTRATNVKVPKTFEMVFIQDEQFGKDKDQIYVLRHTPPHPLEPFPEADLETFEVVGDYYAKDKNKVYYYSYHTNQILIVELANSATFVLYFDATRNTDATDGKHYYKSGILHTEQKNK